MGINSIAGLSKLVATYLGKKGSFTGHSFRRSGATALAEAGISVVGLCHAGGWSSLKVAQEYMEHTELEKRERVGMMDANDKSSGVIVQYKKAKVGVIDDVSTVPNPTGPAVGDGIYSFLKGELSSGGSKNDSSA